MTAEDDEVREIARNVVFGALRTDNAEMRERVANAIIEFMWIKGREIDYDTTLRYRGLVLETIKDIRERGVERPKVG